MPIARWKVDEAPDIGYFSALGRRSSKLTTAIFEVVKADSAP